MHVALNESSEQIQARIVEAEAKGAALIAARKNQPEQTEKQCQSKPIKLLPSVVNAEEFEKAPGFVKQVLDQKSCGAAAVVFSRKSKWSKIDKRNGKKILDALAMTGLSESALTSTNRLRTASLSAKIKKKAVKIIRQKVVQDINKTWESRGRHLLGTKVSLSKTNTTRKILTMESRSEVRDRGRAEPRAKKQSIPQAFKSSCPPALLLQRIEEAGGPIELNRSKGWSKLRRQLAEEVGFHQEGYLPKMGAVLKQYASSLPEPPEGLMTGAKRLRRRLNRVAGGIAGPRLPTGAVLAEEMVTAQSVRAGVLKEVNGVKMRSVDFRALYKDKNEAAVKSGGIKVPHGEGAFEQELLIADWTDGGSKAAKGFLVGTTGFINCGQGNIASEEENPRGHRVALERILASVAVTKESKQSVTAMQTELGAQYEKLADPIDVTVGERQGKVT
jgi:hypothetical protein